MLVRKDTPGSIFDVIFFGCIVYILLYLTMLTKMSRSKKWDKNVLASKWCNPLCLPA
eukprot:SAG31_NODE_2854_length_4992_cov_3.213570_3_plen_57_part_00